MKPQFQSGKTWCASGDIGAHAPSERIRRVVPLLVAGLFVAFGIADADVPTAGDIVACNQGARERFPGGSISPTSKDEAEAEAARGARAGAAALPGGTGHVTQSADPQIHGMDGEGAKDAAYRAAYRVCMRKKGF